MSSPGDIDFTAFSIERTSDGQLYLLGALERFGGDMVIDIDTTIGSEHPWYARALAVLETRERGE